MEKPTPKQLKTIQEGMFTLTTYINRKNELQARIFKDPTNQLVFAKRVASIEEAEDAFYKMIARQEQRIFLRKHIYDGRYAGHLSVFREKEPDTYTVFFFRKGVRGVSRRHREVIVVPFSSKEEMFSFFIKVFNKAVEVYGVGSDKCALQEERHTDKKVARPSFSIKEEFLTKVVEL